MKEKLMEENIKEHKAPKNRGRLWSFLLIFILLGVTAVAPTLEEAVKEAYRLSSEVDFANKYCRSDIGRRALAAQKERE